MLQLRRPARPVVIIIISVVVRQYARGFEVVDEELGAQTVGGDCVRFVQRVLHLVAVAVALALVVIVAVVLREQFLRFVMGGGGGRDAGAVCVEGAEVGGVDGGVDGHLCGMRGVGVRKKKD